MSANLATTTKIEASSLVWPTRAPDSGGWTDCADMLRVGPLNELVSDLADGHGATVGQEGSQVAPVYPRVVDSDDLNHAREWLYEPETPKRKHKWDYDEPGFVEVPRRKGPGTVRVAKCPSSMTNEQAQALLNSGIEWSPRGWLKSYPQRLYVVHDGWLYRAMPTVPGTSYHGFPEDDREQRVPETLHDAIRAAAKDKGCAEEIERWLR